MNKYISLLGSKEKLDEVIKYHDNYFKCYSYYDLSKKCFANKIDYRRQADFIIMSDVKQECANV